MISGLDLHITEQHASSVAAGILSICKNPRTFSDVLKNTPEDPIVDTVAYILEHGEAKYTSGHARLFCEKLHLERNEFSGAKISIFTPDRIPKFEKVKHLDLMEASLRDRDVIETILCIMEPQMRAKGCADQITLILEVLSLVSREVLEIPNSK